MSHCSRCLLDLSLHPVVESGVCPNCGESVKSDSRERPAGPQADGSDSYTGAAPVGPGTSAVLFTRFWQTVWDMIFTPAEFFSRNAGMITKEGSLSSALAFAVIIQWFASFFNFIWRATIWTAFEKRLEDLIRIAGDVVQPPPGSTESLEELRARAVEFLFGAGTIVISPFTTLLKLLLIALLVHAAVRFFTRESADRPHSYSATLKILSYATAPWVLCVIPGIGMIVSYILAFVASVIGIREVYRTTTGRAMVIVAFPELLFVAFLVAIFVFFLFLAFGVYHLVS